MIKLKDIISESKKYKVTYRYREGNGEKYDSEGVYELSKDELKNIKTSKTLEMKIEKDYDHSTRVIKIHTIKPVR